MSGATKEIGAPENRISSSEELCPDAPGTMISNPEFGPVVTARQEFPKQRRRSQLSRLQADFKIVKQSKHIVRSSSVEVLVNRRTKLSASMTLSQFENGYWYATQLKDFGEAIGIPSASKLRKDELERAIRSFLVTGKAKSPTRRNLSTSGIKDVERGLSLQLEVVRYTNDEETKSFLERESQKCVPGLKRKSGVRYRFNRWREEQLIKGVKLTYRDLVEEYVRLNQTQQPFEQIPVDCYVNFMSDFLAAEKGATRAEAIKAWKKLKSLDVPKNYRAWARMRSSKSKY